MKNLLQISKMQLILCMVTILFFTACKKDHTETFSYEGTRTVNYAYNVGLNTTGSFTAKLKSNGKWDYVEVANSQSQADIGPWSSSGDNVTFTFNSLGDAVYLGTKTGNSSLSGTMNASGASGTWTATR